MITSDQVSSVQNLLSNAQTILVLLPSQPELDLVAVGTALTLALSQSGKEVTLASPEFNPAQYPDLTQLELVKTSISNKNLVVSFAYDQTAVEKVSYHIGEESGRFYLTIAPQKGQAPLDKETVELGYAGAEADLIFLVGVHDLELLEQLYLGNEQLFANTTIISLHTFEPEIGQLKLTSTGYLNLSHLAAMLLSQLQLQLGADAATNLLLSIETTTDRFQSLALTPEGLEMAAWLMRQGARRLKLTPKKTLPPLSPSTPISVAPAPALSTSLPVKPRAKVSQAAHPAKASRSLTHSTTTKKPAKKMPPKNKQRRVAKKAGGLDHQPGMMSQSS